MTQRKQIDESLASDPTIGQNNGNLPESTPTFNKAPCETIFEGKNNTFIVLGRDRPGSLSSGYGGFGLAQAGSIDLVSGRASPFPVESLDNKKVYVDNSYEFDAARVVISQRTNIDENFKLASGSIGNSVNRSAIGLKADSVRIMGREGIKLVTSSDRFNSRGDTIARLNGIDLIAGNDSSDMQPIPKGENLTEFLKEIMKTIQRHNSEITYIYGTITTLLEALMLHTHISTVGTVSPSIELASATQAIVSQTTLHVADAQNELLNTIRAKIDYLEEWGNKYINSKWNKTN
jgi:hypothetical protein